MRTCKRCSKELPRNNDIYCSRKCKYISSKKPIDGTKECLYCKNNFPFRYSLKKRSNNGVASVIQQFCKLKCALNYRNKSVFMRQATSKRFKGKPSPLRGRKIPLERIMRRIKTMSGSNHWNWKGGISPKNNAARSCIEIKQWRRAVFGRDNFTCIWCKQKGGKLNADHILSFSKFPEWRHEINNGRTLCEDCHSKTRTFRGRSNSKKLNLI